MNFIHEQFDQYFTPKNSDFSFLRQEDLFYHVKTNISRHVENSLSGHLVNVRARGFTNAHRHGMLTPP